MSQTGIKTSSPQESRYRLVRLLFVAGITATLSACVCGPWGDVQEREESDEKESSSGNNYDAILGMQCRSLMAQTPKKEKKNKQRREEKKSTEPNNKGKPNKADTQQSDKKSDEQPSKKAPE